MITVVAALIENNNKVLIAKRLYGQNAKDKWEFPGGKVEKNESEEHAIEREILEEFDTIVEAIGFINNNICKYPDKTIDLRLYECKYISGEFRLHDHSEYKFVNKNDLLNYDLADADIPLAQYILNIKSKRI